jgi:hypothetical protein
LSCGFLAFTMDPQPRVKRGFRLFVAGIWKRLSDEIEEKIAAWIAKLIFYLIALLIWYAVGHFGSLLGPLHIST